MSMVEIKNCMARCVDLISNDDVVLHEVEFDIKESGADEVHHVVRVMATDPMDAIKFVKQTYGE